MLTGASSRFAHRAQNGLLILLSLLLLPYTTLILLLMFLRGSLFTSSQLGENKTGGAAYPESTRRQRGDYRGSLAISLNTSQSARRYRILVTGVGMSKGLSLARSFYQAGQEVIGADFNSLACGRLSRSLTRFYCLRKPAPNGDASAYIQGLVNIITENKIDLWVSCSGVASAVEDGAAKETIEATTTCRAVQFGVEDTTMLHDKYSFIKRTAELGLTVPETHGIESREEAYQILQTASADKKYIMKTVGVDDSVRANMTQLSRGTIGSSREYLSKLKISPKTPWIMQQFITGPEYCTHSLVIRGQVKIFVSCPSKELLMHYEVLPSESALNQAMLSFTCAFASHHGPSFTGHLSFDFMVENTTVDKPEDVTLYPIECNPRAHTANVLFNDTPGIAEAYLSLLDPAHSNGERRNAAINGPPPPSAQSSQVIIPAKQDKYYWAGHDIVEIGIMPLILFLSLQTTLENLLSLWLTLYEHLRNWNDGTFASWDPLPWWWLYHVYWPIQFWSCLWNERKWSRINVSTMKIFEC